MMLLGLGLKPFIPTRTIIHKPHFLHVLSFASSAIKFNLSKIISWLQGR